MNKLDILVEGWRGISHSYAIINQFQLLELAQRKDINLYYRDQPMVFKEWENRAAIDPYFQQTGGYEVKPPVSGQKFDAILRYGFPLDFRPPEFDCKKLFVFGTSEFGHIPPEFYIGADRLDSAMALSNADVITCSRWAKAGYVNSGADNSRVHILPLGVKSELFKRKSNTQCAETRAKLGIKKESFIFLNVGAVTPNKGVDLLLSAFSQHQQKYPDSILILKGNDTLYNSREHFNQLLTRFDQNTINRLGSTVIYIGNNASFDNMAMLYSIANAYVSPYLAEGFNMPVLEALSCMCPAICTAGGSTDDFTNNEFSLHIKSSKLTDEAGNTYLLPDTQHLLELMNLIRRDKGFRHQAAKSGAKWARQKYDWEIIVNKLVDLIKNRLS